MIQRASTVEWDHQRFSEDNCRLPPIRILQWTHNAHARHTCYASDLLQRTTTISFKKWWRMNAFIISFRCWSPIKCEGGCEAWLEIMLVSTPLPLPSIPIQTLTPFRPEKHLTTFFFLSAWSVFARIFFQRFCDYYFCKHLLVVSKIHDIERV